MHINSLITIFIAQGFFPLSTALANNGLAGSVEVGQGIFWAYGLVFLMLIGFVFYRRWVQQQGTLEQRTLKMQLKELQNALNSCLTQLQNADDYPNECGISDEKRRESLAMVESIRVKIGKTKQLLVVT
jgi:hypothetical protein